MSNHRAFFATTSLCTGLLLAALAAPAWAQTTQPAPAAQPAPATPPAASSDSTEVGELVVTGTRIKTTNYNSPEPVDVITAEQSQLTGNVDTSQILQLSAVAANSVQINNFLTGLIGFAGGDGANTLSLRGLGSDRTLILLNGERVGPAGVGGEVGPIDLNTIPSSLIDHIDILKDGASSIYGSDAVAGVVNIVTKTSEDGGELHAFFNPSQGGGGNIYELNGNWGKTFDKGYVTLGVDYYRQDAVTFGDRSYLRCARDLVTSGGVSADIIDPTTDKDKCFNEVIDTVFDLDSPFNQAYIPNRGAVGGGGVLSPDLGTGLDVNGFQAVGLQICGGFVCTPGATPSAAADIAATRAQMGAVPFDDPRIAKQTALSPDTRYTFTFFGGYDLTPHAHLYTSVLLNQRDSAQTGVSQFFTVVDNGNVFNQALGANPSLSALVGGPANGFGFAEPVIAQVLTNTQTVNYGRFVVGVKGDLPNFGTLTDWTYDVYGQYARSDGSYTTQYVRSDRVNATSFADTPSGCDTSAVNPFFGGPSMDAAEPGVACVPVNYIAAVQNGQFTPAEFNFLYNTEKGHTTYDHMYVEGSATGNVFNLPAGPLAAAVGFQLRRESLNDTPGADFINQNVYNETTSGITKGSESVEEVFGELQIPILKDLPFIQSLNANVSGRFSNYSSYGGNFTYKGTVDWRVNDWLAVRGTYGTAFRAPALFELFLADQTGFLNQIGLDPCINYATSGVSPIIQKNCAAQGIPGNYNGATAGTSSALIATGGGAGHLKAETSDAETIGIVLTPKLWGQTINVAVDYYDYDIDNQINQFGAANILDQCYEAADFPANPFCSLFTRNTTNPTAGLDNITLVNNDFVNIAKEIDQGLDVDLHYATDLPDRYKLTIEGNLAWTFYTSTDLLGGTVNNFLGSIGNPTFDGNVDFKLDHGPWTFNYLLFMIGASSDNAFTPTTLTDFRGTGETVNSNYSVPFYTTSTISVRRKFDKFTIEAGIKNLFNQAPPNISVSDNIEFREGTVTQAVSQYDLIGRSFYFDIDAKF